MDSQSSRFAVKKAILQLNENNPDETYEYATVVVIDSDKFLIPHPLTSFIKYLYGKKDNNFNSQKAAASKIVVFLNWVFIDNNDTYKISNLSQLTLDHAIDFLNHMKTTKVKRKGSLMPRQRSTLEKYEFYLSKFYTF